MLETKSNSWNKLLFDIKAFKDGDTSLGLPLIANLSIFLNNDHCLKTTRSLINRMYLELEDLTYNKTTEEQIDTLQNYFFNTQSFELIPCEKTTLEDWSLYSVLTKKKGSKITLAFLYSCFAEHLELPLYFVNLCPALVFKKVKKNEKTEFYDFSRKGKNLSEKETLSLIHKSKKLVPHKLQLEVCKTLDILQQYLEQKLTVYKRKDCTKGELVLTECLLALDENCADLILHTATLKKQLGLYQEALLAMNRYFSFVEKENASEDTLSMFQELQKLYETPNHVVLH